MDKKNSSQTSTKSLLCFASADICRKPLQELMRPHFQLQRAGTIESWRSSLASVHWDVTLIERDLLDREVIDELHSLGTSRSKTKFFLLLDPCIDNHSIAELVGAGVSGYCYIGDDPNTLLKALLAVSEGEIWYERKIARHLIEKCKRLGDAKPTSAHKLRKNSLDIQSGLTNREKEVAELISWNMSYREIAGQLQISENTVKGHLKNIFEKLGVDNRLQLALRFTNNEH